MKKEALLNAKREIAKDFPWNVSLSDNDLRRFSVAQLQVLASILSAAEERRFSCQTFFPLDINLVVQTATGKIIYVDDVGIREISPEEVMHSAARSIYTDYLRRAK